MTVPLFSTAYFPPVAYVAAMMPHGEALVEVKETFPKQTYRNRAVIMTAGGVRALTVPVVRENHSRTEEVAIDYSVRWNVVHLRTLTAAYAASPYWLYYQDDIERLLMLRYDRLVDLNQAVTEWLLRCLKIGCRLSFTADYKAEAVADYRNCFSPKVPAPADRFPAYCQVFADRLPFAPNLSVLDVLFNLGPEAADYLKNCQP